MNKKKPRKTQNSLGLDERLMLDVGILLHVRVVAFQAVYRRGYRVRRKLSTDAPRLRVPLRLGRRLFLSVALAFGFCLAAFDKSVPLKEIRREKSVWFGLLQKM